jgi:hypothetical protein
MEIELRMLAEAIARRQAKHVTSLCHSVIWVSGSTGARHSIRPRCTSAWISLLVIAYPVRRSSAAIDSGANQAPRVIGAQRAHLAIIEHFDCTGLRASRHGEA